MPSSIRRRATILALVVFASCAYFYEGGGWNQNTRFDLVRAIVERQTTRIDAYHENSGDKAHVDDHFYSDKAPGASLTAVPAVWFVRGLAKRVGAAFGSPEALVWYSYVATLAASSIPGALAALCVFLIAIRWGATESVAAFAALTYALGTPAWAYATIFYGHTLATGCLMGAFYASLRLGDPLPARHMLSLALAVGLLSGWSVVTEYPAIVPGGVISLFALWQVARADRPRAIQAGAAIGIGLAAAAAVLLIYNDIAFGSPFYVTYSSEHGDFEGMKSGLFGVSLPKLSAARQLLVGAHRGLLPLAPVLAITPIGFWWLLRDRAIRPGALVAAFVVVFYFAMTSGYAYWEGGWSYGSRHLGPALPFLCLGLVAVWRHARRAGRAIVLTLACAGAFQSLMAVAVTAQPDWQYEAPMRELIWPAFKSGDFPRVFQSYLEHGPDEAGPRDGWNLGQRAGLRGHASLVPLYGIWIIGVAAWRRAGPRAAP
jgi:hypothetical protein